MGEGDRGGAGGQVELAKDPGDVDADRAGANEERVHDLAIGLAVGQQAQNLQLARRQSVRRGWTGCRCRRRLALEQIDDFAITAALDDQRKHGADATLAGLSLRYIHSGYGTVPANGRAGDAGGDGDRLRERTRAAGGAEGVERLPAQRGLGAGGADEVGDAIVREDGNSDRGEDGVDSADKGGSRLWLPVQTGDGGKTGECLDDPPTVRDAGPQVEGFPVEPGCGRVVAAVQGRQSQVAERGGRAV